VLDCVRDVLQKRDALKINNAFNSKFVTGDKSANKSIATRNYELFHSTDLREWYELRVVEPTLASLEKFQECDSGWARYRVY